MSSALVVALHHELIFRDDPEERKGKVMKAKHTVAKGDNEVEHDYSLHQVDGQGLKIYDIWIDEVSARNYRSRFMEDLQRTWTSRIQGTSNPYESTSKSRKSKIGPRCSSLLRHRAFI